MLDDGDTVRADDLAMHAAGDETSSDEEPSSSDDDSSSNGKGMGKVCQVCGQNQAPPLEL